MRQIRLLLVTVALVSAGLFATVASASAPPAKPFAAAVTEDFSPSCAPRATCGTAVTPYGSATVLSRITSFVRLPSGCFSDHHTSTLTFADGSTLALAVVGTLCPTDFLGNFRFSGSYSVPQGLSTGRFSEATGSGLVLAFRNNGPIHAVFVGTISLSPGQGLNGSD